ncbi:MAG TPA: rhomboid family intramembrane serine protease [Aggregatilineaceae bacterium]|nr:rhomboid family intramembrane serine protease [Aggregatilineaceae bacterium]
MFCLLLTEAVYVILILFLTGLVFPLPVSDTGGGRYRSIPWMTITIIALNVLIFLIWSAPDLYALEYREAHLGRYATKLYMFGYTESTIRGPYGAGAFSSISALFLHASVDHLFGNMLFLWTFGRRVEDACGAWRFLLFYLFAGITSLVGYVIMTTGIEYTPAIGASGAISGVMAAYLLLFPGTHVLCGWGIGSLGRLFLLPFRGPNSDHKIWRWLVRLPAWLLLIGYLLQNIIPSFEAIRLGTNLTQVAYLGHLAGFLAGLTIFLFVRKDVWARYVSGRNI